MMAKIDSSQVSAFVFVHDDYFLHSQTEEFCGHKSGELINLLI